MTASVRGTHRERRVFADSLSRVIKRHRIRMARPRSRRPSGRARTRRTGDMVFARKNYILVVVGLLLVVVGYVIMAIDGEVDGFISLYVAPLFILGGYLEIIYAILWRPRQSPPVQARSAQS